ncbi:MULTISPECIES: SUKH-3 domain-containing protein [unclassified Streptomyces]|uniref:SUKH-3 domain-containing protein n=1 Tax=unclassified Streptomyces TaxID=2593676 RepID=UPI003D74E670
MASTEPAPYESAWLTENGWVPGRDIGERAAELVEVRVRDAARQGVALSASPAAVRIVRSYGLLRLAHEKAAGEVWVMKPTPGYEGDAALIAELAAGLGTGLFPVGYEESERGLLLVDEKGRWFHLHHTGGYLLGADEFDAFSRFLRGVEAPDAEDYFV